MVYLYMYVNSKKCVYIPGQNKYFGDIMLNSLLFIFSNRELSLNCLGDRLYSYLLGQRTLVTVLIKDHAFYRYER